MRIQNNVTATNSHRQYGINVGQIGKDVEKLSSGYRVNRAADDAAGLAISEKMRTQIRGLSMASRNTQDGISLLQVADGAMQIAHGILQRMRELAAQSANGTNDNLVDREALDLEYQNLISELDQIADTTNFNGVYPLKGGAITTPGSTSLIGPGIEGVSSPKIPVMNDMINLVPNATGTALPAQTGTSLTLATAGTYTISATDLGSVTNISLGNNVNLIITGDVSNNLTFTGAGSARINGNVDGNLRLLNSQGKVQVTGHVTGDVLNQGNMTIGPSTAPSPYTGEIINSGKMLLAQEAAYVLSNSGDMRIAANNTLVDDNQKNIMYQPISGSITLATVNVNNGHVEVGNSSTVHQMTENNGSILVQNGARISGSGNENNGLIEIAVGGTAIISTNNDDGFIINEGHLRLTVNNGFAQYGVWVNDSTTPAVGSTQGTGDITNNFGTVRNFSSGLILQNNRYGGIVDNYGTINFMSSNVGTIRHHARQINTAITEDKNFEQFVSYTVNGQPATVSGWWLPDSGGYKLELGAPSPAPAFGEVVYSAWASFRVPNKPHIQYGINQDPANPFTVPNSSGTTGTSLVYFMPEPFPIQSGANEGDAIFLAFRALNATSLGIDAKSPHGVCMFESIGESHIKTMDAASCALTLTLKAINDVSIYRAELGAQYNRLEYTYGNLNNSTENLSASESRIRDADMAKQMTVFTKNNILIQSSTAMLAQANALPQGVLQLLG